MSYAHSTLATFGQMLGTLAHLLDKAEKSGNTDLIDARLAPDMLPLATQVRIAVFQVLNTLNRLAGADLAPEEEDPASFADAKAMVAQAQDAVSSTTAESFVAADAPVEFDIPNGMEFALSAEEYVRDWSIAQLYFHVTTLYAILRVEGIELGKADFVSYMLRHLKAPASA